MSTTTLHESKSLWAETVSVPRHPALEADIETDVCIIGAGIAGLSTAYALATSGKSVVVLDQATVGAGDSGFTSAHLSNAPDPGYAQIEHIHGPHAAKLAAQSHSMAIELASESIP